ncbi:MAG: F0F1 ATP synthase subunit epsilon [Flavobacteriaceae bacterium]|nr:F0F1 ATP synthase subunit epsilon [Flavobacteriaceae bacterium]
MILEIVTPEAILFTGEVDSVVVPGINGEFQILNNHAPIVSLLQEGIIKIKGTFQIEEEHQDKFTKGDDNAILLSINSGTIELKENKIIVLAD